MNNKGFTLIELLIILVVIAIISMFAYNSFADSSKKNKVKEARNQLSLMQMEIAKIRLRKALQYSSSEYDDAIYTNIKYSGETIYTVAWGDQEDNSYTLVATGKSWIPSSDPCHTITMDTFGNVKPDDCKALFN